MYLIHIHVENFRSCKYLDLPIDPFTIFIGENDSGKSSILDILDIAINNVSPEANDFYCDMGNNRSDKIIIELSFQLNEDDTSLFDKAIDRVLKVKREFLIDGNNFSFILIRAPEDDQLNIDFVRLNSEDQKSFLKTIKPDIEENKIRNGVKRKSVFDQLYMEQPKVEKWCENSSNLLKGLINYERYTAMDYCDPASIVGKTFRHIFEQTIYKTSKVDQNKTELISQLKFVEKRARVEISKKVIELQTFVKKYCNSIVKIDYQPSFDFNNGIKQGEFYLDRGFGLHPLSRIGDGTKRRLFMAVTDWDKEVLSVRPKESPIIPLIIRGYDEPDTSLHYDAQRLMFYSISQLANTQNSGIQAILCTHSLTMIDRAPAQYIRLFTIDSTGCTRVSKLDTNNDPEIENFLKEIAAELGITNSIMFYERCFVVVEGPTEYNALPIFYKKLHQRSLIEDGIRLINVDSNSGVNAFLKLFGLNRRDLLIVFIDRDSENRNDVKLTAPFLREIGFDGDFIDQRLRYIGTLEFEDAFSNEIIAEALNRYWKKNDGEDWIPDDIQVIRNSKKFSEDIRRIVWEQTGPEGNKWTKPEFGKSLAEVCPVEGIPNEISSVFTLARQIAGIEHK